MNAKDNTHTMRPQTDDEKRSADAFFAEQFADDSQEKVAQLEAQLATLRREAVEMVRSLCDLSINHHVTCNARILPGQLCACGRDDMLRRAAAFVAKHGGES